MPRSGIREPHVSALSLVFVTFARQGGPGGECCDIEPCFHSGGRCARRRPAAPRPRGPRPRPRPARHLRRLVSSGRPAAWCRRWTASRGAGSCARSRPMSRRCARSRPRSGFPGIWFLNGSYQWSCTALAREEDGAPWLARTLDWPFPGLGRFVEIAHMQGPAGEFYNVTWPGYVGALTAMAPGRFAACINQAPMRRRTRDPRLRLLDLALTRRRRFATCAPFRPINCCATHSRPRGDYAQARHMLETTPVARPVIYTLAGCRPGERCVIERTEDGVETRASTTTAPPTTGFTACRNGRAASAPNKVLTAPSRRPRRTAAPGARAWRPGAGSFERDSFAWVAPPVLNPLHAARGRDVPGARRSARRRLRARRRRRTAEPATLPCEARRVNGRCVGAALFRPYGPRTGSPPRSASRRPNTPPAWPWRARRRRSRARP